MFKLFLQRGIPNESKFLIGIISGITSIGCYIGGRKLLYDPDVKVNKINRAKNNYIKLSED